MDTIENYNPFSKGEQQGVLAGSLGTGEHTGRATLHWQTSGPKHMLRLSCIACGLCRLCIASFCVREPPVQTELYDIHTVHTLRSPLRAPCRSYPVGYATLGLGNVPTCNSHSP